MTHRDYIILILLIYIFLDEFIRDNIDIKLRKEEKKRRKNAISLEMLGLDIKIYDNF
jgi:hypothetical protein